MSIKIKTAIIAGMAIFAILVVVIIAWLITMK